MGQTNLQLTLRYFFMLLDWMLLVVRAALEKSHGLISVLF